MNRNVYVSVTGLTLRRPWHVFRFYSYAIPAFRQAQASKGNLKAEVRSVGRVRHTLTVWESRADMMDFVHSGVHAKALAAFPGFATGRIYGYESDHMPDWEEALQQWQAHGTEY